MIVVFVVVVSTTDSSVVSLENYLREALIIILK